jgi:hypothetical protein
VREGAEVFIPMPVGHWLLLYIPFLFSRQGIAAIVASTGENLKFELNQIAYLHYRL